MPALAPRAVFLSYASEDTEVARRIRGALERAGLEVWFDDSESRGGEAWAAKIKTQIRECALFLALVSVNTEKRTEGCFRAEWQLAEDRSQRVPEGETFILPVVVDFATERGELVPKAFLAAQWIRLLGRDIPMAFAERVRELAVGRPPTEEPAETVTAAKGRTGNRARLGWGIGAVVATFLVVFGCSRR